MRVPRLIVLFAAVVVTLASLPACSAGTAAREEVLAPALSLAAVGFRSDVAAGLATLPPGELDQASAAVAVFFEAVSSRDRVRIVGEAIPVWPVVRDIALAGIDAKLAAGEVGPNGAESLRERVSNLGEGLARVVERLE